MIRIGFGVHDRIHFAYINYTRSNQSPAIPLQPFLLYLLRSKKYPFNDGDLTICLCLRCVLRDSGFFGIYGVGI